MLYKGDTLYLDWLEDGIAELVFDAPGSVNKLDTATVASLGEAIFQPVKVQGVAFVKHVSLLNPQGDLVVPDASKCVFCVKNMQIKD